MLTCPNVLSELEISQFKNYWNNNQDKTYINWKVDDKVLDKRLVISKQNPLYTIIEKIVHKYIPNENKIWAALQRQSFAHQIHIDDYGSDAPAYRYTFVFSLDTNPKFKTFVWKERMWNNEALGKFLTRWGETKQLLAKKSNLSFTEDLEHTFDENQNDYLCDYLELDAIYTYEAGSGVLFHADQLHCTSNWIKYSEITHRDLLQIHVITDQYLDI